MKLKHLVIAALAVTAVSPLALTARADDAPAPAQSPQSPPQNPPKAVPGWLVDIMPYVKEGKPFRLLSIAVPSREVSFGIHNSVRNLPQNVWHHGAAQMNIFSAGDYGFSLHIDLSKMDSYTDGCDANLKVGNTPVFDVKQIKRTNGIAELNGNVSLEAGNYDITYNVGCSDVNKPDDFQKNGSYSVQILGPDDNLPRFFKPDELFTVKAK